MPQRILRRVPLPDRDTFFREYVHTRTPAIFTNVFANQPIMGITSLREAREAFGSVRLAIQQEYMSAALSAEPQPSRFMTFDEYFDFAHAHPEIDLICGEYEIPPRIMQQFRLPRICLAQDDGGGEVLAIPRKYGDHDLWANVFIAGAGNKAHLHYDGDHRQVFLHHVFGEKQAILFPPESARHLKPLDAKPGFSGIDFDEMSEAEIGELLDRADGYRAMLQPGDTLYIPMLMWHHLKYDDDAMSFNFRFGRNPFGRFLCLDHFHRDYYLQIFASRLSDTRGCLTRFGAEIDAISRKYLEPATSLEQKVIEMRALFRSLCDELCPEADAGSLCPPHREASEVRKVLREIEGSMAYASPQVIATTRPSGPASPVQQRHLTEEIGKRGYDPATVQHLLMNRVGKSDLRQLNKAEAGQFMQYLRSDR
jgi:lysine-specific demethylase 8